eukprot:3341512-Alexandrium_andersonii.AAC.1
MDLTAEGWRVLPISAFTAPRSHSRQGGATCKSNDGFNSPMNPPGRKRKCDCPICYAGKLLSGEGNLGDNAPHATAHAWTNTCMSTAT